MSEKLKLRDDIAKTIFIGLLPKNLIQSDWDSGALLGENDAYRKRIIRTANTVVAKVEAQIAEAKSEAEELATWLWKKHYQEEAPDWKLCDSVAGVISQIDNMVCQLVLPKQIAEAVRECERIATPRDNHVGKMIRNRFPQFFKEKV
jgi:hypothetical protein